MTGFMITTGMLAELEYSLFVSLSGISVGVLISLVLWLSPQNIPICRGEKGKIGRMVITILITTALVIFFMQRCNVSKDVAMAYTLVTMLASILRVIRMRSSINISRKRLHIMTLLDMIICGVLLLLLKLWIVGVTRRGILCLESIYAFPLLYTIFCGYVIYNFSFLLPSRLKLATWRLIAYAFPEGLEHREGSVGKPQSHTFHVVDLVGWMLFFLVSAAGWLFGYWIMGHWQAGIAFFASILCGCGAFILKNGWRATSDGTWRGKLGAVILGSGIIAVFTCFLIILSSGDILAAGDPGGRSILAFTVCSMVMLLGVQFVTELPKSLAERITVRLNSNLAFQSVGSVARSAQAATLGDRKVKTLQAIIVAAVFLAYFVLPHTGSLFTAAGFTHFKGKSIHVMLQEFEETANTWVVPNPGNSSDMKRFIFGNQGAVLLFLLWALASLMAWTDAEERLKRVPNLCQSRISRILASLHVAVFVLYFMPFLTGLALLIPLAGSWLFGHSLSVILGVFAFGFFLPRLEAYLLAFGYLTATLLNTNEIRDRLDVNTAKLEDLVLLPGIGPRLAKRIVKGRPYATAESMASVRGCGQRKTDKLKDLVYVRQGAES